MKVNNRSLPERTADTILMMIHKENLTAGMRLPNENVLAAQLEVSRSTLRSAIRILAEQNILRVERGSGTYISGQFGMSKDPLGYSAVYDKQKLVSDLLQIRLMVEPNTALLAAQYAKKQEIRQLYRLCDEMEKEGLTPQEMIEKDMAFHQMIADCSRNSVIYHLLPMIHQMQILYDYVFPKRHREETIREHRRIAEAINQHDGAEALERMQYHLLVIRTRLGIDISGKIDISDKFV